MADTGGVPLLDFSNIGNLARVYQQGKIEQGRMNALAMAQKGTPLSDIGTYLMQAGDLQGAQAIQGLALKQQALAQQGAYQQGMLGVQKQRLGLEAQQLSPEFLETQARIRAAYEKPSVVPYGGEPVQYSLPEPLYLKGQGQGTGGTPQAAPQSEAPPVPMSPVGQSPPVPTTTYPPTSEGRTVPAGARQAIPVGGTSGGQFQSDVQANVEGIKSGRLPPDLKSLYRMGAPVKAGLEREGFDLTKAQLEYKRAEKQIQSLGGPQMTRLVGLINSVDRTVDEVRSLSQSMKLSGVPMLNKAELMAYIQAYGNSPGGQLATKYITAVNTLKSEFAQAENGGYAPIEEVWKLANRQINENYGVNQMNASLGEIQRLLRYRAHAIPNIETMGPGAANRYIPGGGASNLPPAPEALGTATPDLSNITPEQAAAELRKRGIR